MDTSRAPTPEERARLYAICSKLPEFVNLLAKAKFCPFDVGACLGLALRIKCHAAGWDVTPGSEEIDEAMKGMAYGLVTKAIDVRPPTPEEEADIVAAEDGANTGRTVQ